MGTNHEKVDLVIEENEKTPLFLPMKAEKNGFFSLLSNKAKEGSFYWFRLSQSDLFFADPASRYQIKEPQGCSVVINPTFNSTDKKWSGLKLYNQVAYEMHIGTFTEEGTFDAASKKIPLFS